MTIMEAPCPWAILSTSLQPWLGATVILLGGLGAVANAGLVTSLVFSELSTSLPHVSLLYLVSCAVAGLGRSLLAGFPFTAPGLITGGWIFGPLCCQLFAALGQFFFSAQLATLAALAFERCRETEACYSRGRGVLVKRPTNKSHLGTVICWGFGILWAVPPLFQIGRYACDVTHTSCDLDWRISSAINTAYNASFALFGVIAPIGVTIVWLSRALILGCQAHKDDPWDPDFVQAQQTKAIATMTGVLLITYLPKAALALWSIFGFPRDLYIQIHLPLSLISTITITNEITTLVIPTVLFIFDFCVRGSLLRMWQYHNPNYAY